jgi:hypothetical protein
LIIISGELTHNSILDGQKGDFVFDIGENPVNKNTVDWGNDAVPNIKLDSQPSEPTPTPED